MMDKLSGLVTLPFDLERSPPPFEKNDIKYPESLVRHFLGLYTRKGQRVFDPFAGLGTTLFVAEEMGRKAYGIEADAERHEWVAGQLENWMAVHRGDAARMDRLGLPKMDFCMTSPPFMPITDKWNPLFAGNPAHAGYDAYLRRMGFIFKKLSGVMKKGAMVVVQVDNIEGRRFTPLVRDIGWAVSQSLQQVGEVTVLWQPKAPPYPKTTCLVFKNK